MAYSLAMTFTTDLGKKSTLSISDVKENLTEAEALALMDLIISKNIFESSQGSYVAKSSAQLTKTEVTKFNI